MHSLNFSLNYSHFLCVLVNWSKRYSKFHHLEIFRIAWLRKIHVFINNLCFFLDKFRGLLPHIYLRVRPASLLSSALLSIKSQPHPLWPESCLSHRDVSRREMRWSLFLNLFLLQVGYWNLMFSLCAQPWTYERRMLFKLRRLIVDIHLY